MCSKRLKFQTMLFPTLKITKSLSKNDTILRNFPFKVFEKFLDWFKIVVKHFLDIILGVFHENQFKLFRSRI